MPGSFNTVAYGINNWGQIVGTYNDGRCSGAGCAAAHGFLATPVSIVPVDIQPTTCPNRLHVTLDGDLRVAILGTEAIDAARIDSSTVRLAGIAAKRWRIRDVGTPFEPFVGKSDKGDCLSAGADGHADLLLFFDAPSVIAALGDVENGDVLVLALTGSLKPKFGSLPIRGEDVVVIRKRGAH